MRNPVDDLIWKYYPKGSITQFFGENPKLYANMGLAGHNGIDVVKPWGTPILAVSDQKVVEAKDNPGGYGRHVRCVDGSFEYTYGHLSEIKCSIGQKLREGEILGLMGNTGFVVSGATPYWKHNPYAGTHLHFGMRQIGPWTGKGFFVGYPTGETFQMFNYDNGFKGAIDPLPYFQDDQAAEIQRLLTIRSVLQQLIVLYQKLNILKGRAN